jgi:hypothetical protein
MLLGQTAQTVQFRGWIKAPPLAIITYWGISDGFQHGQYLQVRTSPHPSISSNAGRLKNATNCAPAKTDVAEMTR